MAPLRIKVEFAKKNEFSHLKQIIRKFVYTINSPLTTTIDELTQTLQDYIIQRYSHFHLQIIHLTTVDDFILSKTDLCSTVLKDNDHIICVDMDKFIDEYYKCFKDTIVWLERKQFDAANNQEKVLEIGLNNASELFIRLCGITNVNGLYIFGMHELINIAKEKREDTLIGRIDNTHDYNYTFSGDWFLECKWEYDTDSNTTLFIICRMKVGSSDEIWSNKLQLLLDHSHMRIEKGEITHVSGDASGGLVLSDTQRQRLKELAAKLPPPKRSGPQIDTTIDQNLKITNYECEGESSIRMACVDKPVSVVTLTVLYQLHDGSWCECEDVAIALTSTHGEETKWSSQSIINIPPDKLISYGIKGTIFAKGECGRTHETRCRMHKCFPQPLKLKIVVTDNFNKQCSLIVEQLNKPLTLMTRELTKQRESHKDDILAFVYADDYDNDQRIYVWMSLVNRNELYIKHSDSRSMSLNRKQLLTMEYNAKQHKITEMDLKIVCFQDNTDEIKSVILFDELTYLTYGIRFEITTKTSKTEETVFIPIDKIK